MLYTQDAEPRNEGGGGGGGKGRWVCNLQFNYNPGPKMKILLGGTKRMIKKMSHFKCSENVTYREEELELWVK